MNIGVTMMLKNLALLLMLATVTASPLNIQPTETRAVIESDDISYRLAGTIIPYSYNIEINLSEEVFTENGTTFTGFVEILFSPDVSVPITTFEIHAPVNISAMTIQTVPSLLETNVTLGALNSSSSKLTVTTYQLSSNENYTLRINYTGEIETVNMQGVYKSSYLNALGQTEYLVTTQFQPDYARKAFPCFDEPEYKATFSLRIKYPSGLLALFNTKELEVQLENDGNYTTSVFPTSPVMPTYLVAFVVSKFDCSGLATITGNIPHQVCSRPDLYAERRLANEYGPQLMASLENATDIQYSTTNDKMDQIAIPDFSAGAMENWGLVTYREMALLFNDNESSAIDKQRIITTIAHEFAHTWFGNLVTMKWWNNLFLNEGFASYFEYFTPASLPELEIDEAWELAKQFIVDQQQSVLQIDGTNTSRALSAQASNSAEISGKFDALSYFKGASVIRMVDNFIGHENFLSGIRAYLRNNSYSNTEPSNLWDDLQRYTPTELLPSGVSLGGVMENWINKAGYPLIHVSASGNDVFITQKRFLYSGTDSTHWFVPISYTTAADTTQFQNVTPKIWLVPGDFVLRLPAVLANNSWIVLNNQESAYYRVNYDSTLWGRIQNVLVNDHASIDVLNRAQIVDDVFNLARAGQIRYSEAINILNYLSKENEYYPLYAAAVNFDILVAFIGENSEIGRELNNLQLKILETVKGNVSFIEANASNHIYTLKRRLILPRLCRLGDQGCISIAQELFRNYSINNQVLENDLKPTIYCNSLRYSNNSSEWNYLWDKLQTTRIASEQVTILSTLGCTKNRSLLIYYLEQSINASSGIRYQDITRVWSSVITSNPEGIDVALEFFSNNSERIRNHFASSVSVISLIASRLTTSEQLERLETLANNTEINETIRTVTTAALNTAKNNYNWATEMRPQLEEHFRRDDSSSSARNVGVTTVTLLLAIVALCVYVEFILFF